MDLLLEAGHPVVPVNPNAIKTWRDGEVLSGAKSDAGDAAVIAEYLRLRQHRLRLAAPYSDQTKALRSVVRTRDDLVEMRVAATNQLSALLEAHWPGAKAIFADVESPISLAFLTRYPTPAAAAPPGREADGRVLRQARLLRHAAPPPSCSPACAPPRPAHRPRPSPRRCATPCSPLVAVLTALNAAVKDLDRSAAAQLGEHPDGDDLHVAAKVGSGQRRPVLAEWGDCRQAYDGPDSVAALAGCTPVTRQSGKHRGVPLPLGLQQAVPQARSPPSPATAATPAPGPPRSTTTPAPRQRPPPRRPHPRPRLDPRHLALLAQRHALRPRPHGAAAALAEQLLSKSRPAVDTGGHGVSFWIVTQSLASR